jgi:hypothetical protein
MRAIQSEIFDNINTFSACGVELVSKLLIERAFFQNDQIPRETLLYLANDLIRALQPEESVKMNVAKELLITYKQLRGQKLTEEEQKYDKAERDIDVFGEVLNGVRYSTMAFLGKSIFSSIVSTVQQRLWQHVPALAAYTGAVLLGPHLIRSAVDNVLYYSRLSSIQQHRLRPWLNAIGRLALGFMPKVHASEAGVHYHYPSRVVHTETYRESQSVNLFGEDVTLKKYGKMHTQSGEFDVEYVAQFKLQNIYHLSEQSIKIHVVNQSGVKVPVEFHLRRREYGPEIEVYSTDPNLAAHWMRYFKASQQPIGVIAASANEHAARVVNVYERQTLRPALADYLPQLQINYGQVLTTALAVQLGYQKTGRFFPSMLMASTLPLTYALQSRAREENHSTFLKSPGEWHALKQRIQDALATGDLNAIDVRDLIIYGMHAALAGKGKELIVFFGPTGAGKSASIDFLMGIKLNLVKKNNKWVIEVDPADRDKVFAEIGNFHASQTFAPAVYSNGSNDFGDLPGSLGNRGGNTSIAEAVSTKMLFDNIAKAKIVLCVSHTSFDDARGNTLRDTVMKFTNLLPSYADYSDSILFMVTRAIDVATKESLSSQDIQLQLKEFAAQSNNAVEKKVFEFLSRNEKYIKVCNKVWDVGNAEREVKEDILSTLQSMSWINNTKAITNIPYSDRDKLELTQRFDNIASSGRDVITRIQHDRARQRDFVQRSIVPSFFFKKVGEHFQQPNFQVKEVIDSYERIVVNNRAKIAKLQKSDVVKSVIMQDELSYSIVTSEIVSLGNSIYQTGEFLKKANKDYLALSQIDDSLEKLNKKFEEMQIDFDYLINFMSLTADKQFVGSEIINLFLEKYESFRP